MTDLKLEVGKFYMTRDGKFVKIISAIEPNSHPYEEGFRFVAGGCGQYYTEAGLTYVDGTTNPGDIVSGGLTDTEYFNSKPRFHPSTGYTEINDGMCLIILGALSGEVFDLSALEDGTTVSVKNAVIAIKAAFEHAKKLPKPKAKVEVGKTYLNKVGTKVNIVAEEINPNNPGDPFRFKSSDGNLYDQWGQFKYDPIYPHTFCVDLILN